MDPQRPTLIPQDHPLYYRKGRERELQQEWARRKQSLLLFFVPTVVTTIYFTYWMLTRPASAADLPLPREIRAALATFVASVIGGFLNWVFLASCPRCNFPIGFDWSLAGVFGQREGAPAFHCRNCKAKLT